MSWLARLKAGLGKTSSKLAGGIAGVFTRRRLDQAALDELEELLIAADLGVATAGLLVRNLARARFEREVESHEILEALAEEAAELLEPVAVPLVIDSERRPHVILVCGVNGSGKTTTIGKLAKQFKEQGRSVMLVAGDTFRAAAVEQLRIWGERTGCPVMSREEGADAAGLAFDAIQKARAEGTEVVLIDTAGRLQNKAGLMEELKKVIRVVKKVDETAPHDTLLVMDATIGQNAHSQVEAFRDMVQVSGLVMTKLDGSAKGGVVVGLADRFKLPVHAVGVGEGVDDLRPFEARAFARALMGLED